MFLSAPIVEASLPGAIENAIRSWFNSAAQLVHFRFAGTLAPTTPDGFCDVYMDRTTLNIVGKCSTTGAPTVIVSSSNLGCVQDNEGNLTCNAFASLDQGGLTPPAANRWRLYDNDVDITPDPSCTDYGEDGVLTLLDTDESVNDTWVFCDGTTQIAILGAS